VLPIHDGCALRIRAKGATVRTDVAVVAGTRPEIIKLVGVLSALGERARLIHTGQHFDRELWAIVARDLALREPALRINVGGLSRGEQIGTATTQLTHHLLEQPVGALIVQGDTNSTLAGALAAEATGTPLLHVEAGLRSGDLGMPEEINRLLTDRLATVCCAPTEANAATLISEGIPADRIRVTGNTLADALGALLPAPPRRSQLLAQFGVSAQGYALVTLHRAGNVDDPSTLRSLLPAICALAELTPVLLPMHPHTRARIVQSGLASLLGCARVLAPLSPQTFLALEEGAGLVVTDSGGVQEEAALLGVPCLILRNSTERPELLAGWSRLLGDDDPVEAVTRAWADASPWRRALAAAESPYPPGSASAQIAALACDLADVRAIPDPR
jgi:UDP-N-acetylglucosamine 2-epimerase (non-hydrolysing)